MSATAHITFVAPVAEPGDAPEFVRRSLCGQDMPLEARERELRELGGEVAAPAAGEVACRACERTHALERRVAVAFAAAASEVVAGPNAAAYAALLVGLVNRLRWERWAPDRFAAVGPRVTLRIFPGGVIVKQGPQEWCESIEGPEVGRWAGLSRGQ